MVTGEFVMKMNFRIVAKFGLLLVIIGFFMPVACDQNGFQIAEFMIENDRTLDGLFTYLLFVFAIAGVLVGFLLLMNRNILSYIDWIIIVGCIASGLIVYFNSLKNNVELQIGAYVILAGWAVAFALQLISKTRNEK